MSEGVSYRIGYLTGHLKAYENEEDLKKLVEQRIKVGTIQPKVEAIPKPPKDESAPKYEGMQLREAVLVYMDKALLGSKPAEITLKSGKEKRTGIPHITAGMNPLLRVFIPMRDNDESVPQFVRTFDFKLSDDDAPRSLRTN